MASRPPSTHSPSPAAAVGVFAKMLDGVLKMPAPTMMPTTRLTASSSPRGGREDGVAGPDELSAAKLIAVPQKTCCDVRLLSSRRPVLRSSSSVGPIPPEDAQHVGVTVRPDGEPRWRHCHSAEAPGQRAEVLGALGEHDPDRRRPAG